MKKLSTAAILAIVMALLVVTGALASFTNGNFETGDFTGWIKDTANQNGGIVVGPPPSYVPHPMASVDDMFIVNTAWMNTNFGAGITCDPYSNGQICLPYAGANSAVVNYLGNNGNLNKLSQAGLVAGGDLGADGNYHIFFSYAPVLDKGTHTPVDQPFMYVKLVRVRSGSPDVVLFDKFSYPDDGNPNWQISPVRSSVKFMPWQVYDLTYAPGDLTPGDTLTLEVVAAGCVYFQGAHWGYVYVDEFGPTAPEGNTAPSISSVSPAFGPDSGGTSVTITGSNFTGATAVKIGTTTLLAGSFTVVNDTTIIFVTPANAAGLVDVSVTNPNGSAVYPYSYTYLAAPTITSIAPNSGPLSGGTSVVITGTNLTGGTVTFDGLPATCTVDSATQITCTSPAHAAGPVDVVVTTIAGSATSTGGFTYIAPPTITTIVPNSGPAAGGTSVVITGTALTGGTVTFGGTTATCTVDSPTQMTCTSPAHAAGPVDVVVTTIGGTATSVGGFTYIPAPTITGIAPNSGPTAGGTSVVITGTDLTGGTVTFDGLPATCTVDSPTQMTCTSPAHAAGPVNVVVTTPGGSATSTGGFTYIAESITGIAPNSGPTGGGTSVVISGTGFTGSTGFTIGGTAATCTVDSDVQITCTTPAHAAGVVDVVVTTPTGTVTLTDGFTYIPSTLTLTASGPATIKPGQQYVYTFDYTLNVKPFNAQVVFTLPGHTTFVSNTGGYTCTPAAGVVTCNLGGITTNGSFTATVLVDKLKKVNTPLTLATTAYSISDNGAAVVNGAATVTANTLAPFDDVPAGYWASDYVQAIWAAGITGGCSATPSLYCPTVPLTRAQMAIFIERGVHGSSFIPPVVPITFNDTTTHSARYWIEALKADGITAGCGTTGAGYCPEASITRAQMSIFLLRGKYGRAHVPPVATGTVWGDVLATSWAAAWMEQLGNEGISGGCGGGNFCPSTTVSREQMAVLVQRTFNLPLPTP